ncbi:biopolymer transporter ExbD (plasmid) [Leisingera sp. S132]|uniref:ExbD/TolR family protein n=1 Tax=Leisingera sp. S132 TaxID=2867016 RepID=UPI0021A975C8|nr:biopolymer transporter ExbD [Leisingera sp. S132]UWQ81767.1 biopolymer transporter ExbD [Leisingera sp. S132]
MQFSRLGLPAPRQRRAFSLTPLADIMFQLLIFFMLSSSLTPYSVLPLHSSGPVADRQPGPAQSAAAAQAPQASVPGGTALWNLEAGKLRVQGQDFPLEALPGLARSLREDNPEAAVVVIVKPSAKVQDLTTVLEQLRVTGIASVQLSAGAG